MSLLADQQQHPEERAGWKRVAASLVIVAIIVVLATAGSFGAAHLFDYWTQFEGPRAFRAGETEDLLTARVAASLFGFQVVTVALVFFADMRFRRNGESLLSFGMPRGGIGTLILAVLLLLVLAALVGALGHVFDDAAARRDLGPFVELVRSRAWWLILIAAGLGAPLAEELLFRGVLFGVLRRSALGFMGTAVVTSVLWAALHVNYSVYGIITVLVIGLYLALLRERTGTLMAPIVAHGAYNSLIVVILAFTPSWLVG